jgi:predicted RNase H-like HicB family nuclease
MGFQILMTSAPSNTSRQPVSESFTYWRESDGHFLGYLNAYPDHWTQGEDLEDLKLQLLDLYHEFAKQGLPGIRQVGELVVA